VFSLVIFGRVLFLKEKQIDKDNCQVLFVLLWPVKIIVWSSFAREHRIATLRLVLFCREGESSLSLSPSTTAPIFFPQESVFTFDLHSKI